MANANQLAFLAAFAPVAVAVERSGGFPAEVIIAQTIAESDWGERVTGVFNYWGLTAATCPARPKKFCPTTEVLTLAQFVTLPFDERASVIPGGRVDLGHGKYRYSLSRWFACFDSLADGIGAYVGVITAPGHRYYSAWMRYTQDRNVDALIDGIARAGYASGSGYGALLKSIAHEGPVFAALVGARAAA